MKLPASQRLRRFAPPLLVLVSALLAMAAYWQALPYRFISDDMVYIVNNPELANLPASELWRLLTRPYNTFNEFLPLRELSYWVDMALFGQNPAPFRLHNMVLYLLCLPLVYVISASLWRQFRPADAASASWAAAAVTALFALHPAHVEAVVWIAGRKDVLSGMLSLFALWLALRAGQGARFSGGYATAALMVLLAAIYSKATTISMAVIIALLWLMSWRNAPTGERSRPVLLWACACLLLAAGAALTFAAITTQRIPAYFGIEMVARTLAILGWLVRLSFTPESRHYYYPVLEHPWLISMLVLGVISLFAAGLGAVFLLRRRLLEGFSVTAFLLLCLPSLQLVPYKPPSLVSDRFLFMAIWPAMLLLVALAWRMRPHWRTLVLLVFALPWFYQSTARPQDLRSDEALTYADFHAYPSFYMPASLVGMVFQMGNDQYRDALETAGNIQQAEIRETLTKLIQADFARRKESAAGNSPDVAMGRLVELGRMLERPPEQSKWDAPMLNLWQRFNMTLGAEWERLAEKYPDNVAVRYNAGMYDMRIHFYLNAVGNLQAALRSPQLPASLRSSAHLSLGVALMNTGRAEEAESELNAALLQPNPAMEAHCALAELYKQGNRMEASMRAAASCALHKQES